MTHFPLADWADKSPSIRWTAVAIVLSCTVAGAYYLTGKYDEAQDVEDARIAAELDDHLQFLKQQALQDQCGGPEATVTELALGGYKCTNKRGKETIIPGLARPDNTTHGTAARDLGARLQREVLKSANLNQSAGVVSAGFLKGSTKT